jgi:Zn-dependent peptidase ImmA (M78 family)
MKKRIPKTLTILGRKYKLRFVSEKKMIELIEAPAWAAVDFTNKQILIQETLSEEEMMISLIHEIGHIAHVTSGLNQIIPQDICEIICETSANAFLDLIRSIHK